jgi:hypothetical protein
MIYTIYKISIANQDYIGSTRDLKHRKGQHKATCNVEDNPHYHYKLYQYIRENGGWDCCDITPIEEFECETKQQALIREEYWRREYKATLNMRKAYRTEDERKNEIKISNIKACKKRNDNSKLEIPTECECGGRYKKKYKSEHINSKKHQEFISSCSPSIA